MGRMIGAALVVAVLLGGLALALGTGVLSRQPETDEPLRISPEAAASAAAKLARLGSEGEEVRLNGVEITSLIRHRPALFTLGTLIEPEVQIRSDTLHLTGSVATDELPAEADLGSIRQLLPDTTSVYVAGTIHALEGGATILQIASLEVAGIPIPDRYYPMILERLGRPDDGSLPPGSVALPLPAAVRAARLEDGFLHLTPSR
ncbi:MAG: hypothetical protein WD737_04755 [Gemmatimonadota bacterium]